MLFLELICAVLLGVTAGVITGLIPGIHVNLISILLLSLSTLVLRIVSPITLACFIIAMSIVHTFLDSIPSIFLGAPDSEMALGVLPGHRMLLKGDGYMAVKLTVIGSLLAFILTVAIIPLMIPLVPIIYSFIQPFIGYMLVVVVIYMILKEKGFDKKALGFFVFSISGILGIIVLNMPILKQPLFPMLSGLFGTSTLLMSLNDNTKIPKQKIKTKLELEKKNTFKAIGASVFSGSLTGMLPGLGGAQAAVIATEIVGDIGSNAFMILLGGINTVNFLFSIVTLYTIEKARNGAIVVVKEITEKISMNDLIILISAGLITAGIATFLALRLTKVFAKIINKINYRKVCITIILFISFLVMMFDGFTGLLVLITSTALGMIPAKAGVKRSLNMGCLLLPVILFFLL